VAGRSEDSLKREDEKVGRDERPTSNTSLAGESGQVEHPTLNEKQKKMKQRAEIEKDKGQDEWPGETKEKYVVSLAKDE